MYFESMEEFISMGGHGFYVWLSYGIGISILIWNIASMRLKRARALSIVHRSLQRRNALSESE